MSKTKLSKDERERAEEESVCTEFSVALGTVAGFEPHVEPVHGYVYKRGGALSLATMKQIVERLTKPAKTKPTRRQMVAAQRELFTEAK